MKREVLRWFGRAIMCGMVAGSMLGCATPRQPVVVSPTGEIYVPKPPPAPLADQPVGVAPRLGDEWVPGYWTYHGYTWAWMPGHWAVPPQSGQSYVAGHWDDTVRGWVYTPGHWE